MSDQVVTMSPQQFAEAHHHKKMQELYIGIGATIFVLIVIIVFISVKYRKAARYVGTWSPKTNSIPIPASTAGTISYTLAAGSSKYELVDGTSANGGSTANNNLCTLNGPYTYKLGMIMRKVKQYDASGVLMADGSYAESSGVVTITWDAPSTAYTGTGAPATSTWSLTLPKTA